MPEFGISQELIAFTFRIFSQEGFQHQLNHTGECLALVWTKLIDIHHC